ncbi:hypothetical protein U1Q18_019584 [Sarracenia purpurea var. burkii]
MFKSARWRSEKNKIKAVFKLQFHATQVGWDGLMISLVPADAGKPTSKLEKAAIRDGSCYWETPIYENVKLLREPKSGKIHEKIYNFVVSTGSSKASLVGEVSIDFASYAESTKFFSLSLPLKNTKFDAILNVSIQRLPENINQREATEIEVAKINSTDRSLKTKQVGVDADGSINSNSTEDVAFHKTISHISELNGNGLASIGLNNSREFGLKNDVSILRQTTPDISTTIHEEQQRSQWEWFGGSAPDLSTDDSSSSPRDALPGEVSREGSKIIVEKLETELNIPSSRLADMSLLELQTLKKQIVKERKRGQDLLREVVDLKEERDALKEECEKLKAFWKCTDDAKVRNNLLFEGEDLHAFVEELRQELDYEKELNAKLRLQLQKTKESNSELILAEELEEEINSKSEIDDDGEQKTLEELLKGHSDVNRAHVLEQKITNLHKELEIYRRDKEDLEAQMEQLALDYEFLKQENYELSYKLEQSQLQEQLKMQYECSSPYVDINELEAEMEDMETQLKNQSNQLSDSLDTITKLETCVTNLEEELEKQAQGFETDVEILIRDKVEQEQRAIIAEEALRKMRLQNFNTAERLQVEFQRLSVQIASTVEANEKLTTKALMEANELRLQKSNLEELVQKAKEEIQLVRDQYEAKLYELSSQILISLKVNRIEQLQSEIEAKTKQLEHGKKHGEENYELYAQEIVVLKAEIERVKMENNNLSDDNKSQSVVLDGAKTTSRNLNKSSTAPHSSKEIANLNDKINLLEVAKDSDYIAMNGSSMPEQVKVTAESLSTTASKSDENGSIMMPMISR